MSRPSNRSIILEEVADWLAKVAKARHARAVQCSPGSDQRRDGQVTATEIAQLSVVIAQAGESGEDLPTP